MKRFTAHYALLSLLLSWAILSCSGSKKATTAKEEESITISETEKEIFAMEEADTLKIEYAESNYEIIIIEPGFANWLRRVAQPRGYYSQRWLEMRNQILVMEWNRRTTVPLEYDPQLYFFPINYDHRKDYGYDVNYELYHYFVFIQRKYNQRLGPGLPRI